MADRATFAARHSTLRGDATLKPYALPAQPDIIDCSETVSDPGRRVAAFRLRCCGIGASGNVSRDPKATEMEAEYLEVIAVKTR